MAPQVFECPQPELYRHAGSMVAVQDMWRFREQAWADLGYGAAGTIEPQGSERIIITARRPKRSAVR